MVDKEIFKKRRHINVPKPILKPIAKILNQALWWHTLSADEVEREFMDQVIDPEAKTFKDLGIEPSDIINFTYHYLVSYFGLATQFTTVADTLSSKGSEARTTTICHRRQRRRSGKRRSTSTFRMSCKT